MDMRWVSIKDWIPEKNVRVLVSGRFGIRIAHRAILQSELNGNKVDINVWLGEDGQYLFPRYWTLLPDFPIEPDENY